MGGRVGQGSGGEVFGTGCDHQGPVFSFDKIKLDALANDYSSLLLFFACLSLSLLKASQAHLTPLKISPISLNLGKRFCEAEDFEAFCHSIVSAVHGGGHSDVGELDCQG